MTLKQEQTCLRQSKVCTMPQRRLVYRMSIDARRPWASWTAYLNTHGHLRLAISTMYARRPWASCLPSSTLALGHLIFLDYCFHVSCVVQNVTHLALYYNKISAFVGRVTRRKREIVGCGITSRRSKQQMLK